MTPDKEAHLDHLNAEFARQNDPQYRKGAIEHGGKLWDMPVYRLLHEIRSEAIDTFNYAQTAIDKLEQEPEEEE